MSRFHVFAPLTAGLVFMIVSPAVAKARTSVRLQDADSMRFMKAVQQSAWKCGELRFFC